MPLALRVLESLNFLLEQEERIDQRDCMLLLDFNCNILGPRAFSQVGKGLGLDTEKRD